MTESAPTAESKKELHAAIVRKVVGIILAAPDKEEQPWGISAESKEKRGAEPVASFAAYSEARLCERDPTRQVSLLADFALLGAEAEDGMPTFQVYFIGRDGRVANWTEKAIADPDEDDERHEIIARNPDLSVEEMRQLLHELAAIDL